MLHHWLRANYDYYPIHVSYITYIGSMVQRCSSPYGQQERRNVGGGGGGAEVSFQVGMVA